MKTNGIIKERWILKMKKAVTIIVIIGILASIGLGIKWLSDYNAYKDEIETLSEFASSSSAVADSLKEINTLKTTAFVLIACGIIALVIVFLAKKIGTKLAGGIILLTGVIPGILSPSAFIFTFILILGGLLAIFSKPQITEG
jgi:uncharacterized protein YybS (DUF2232 family)